MAGKFAEPTTEEHDEVYLANLKYCAKELQERDMIGLIEPINKYALPGYFLNNYDKGKGVIIVIISGFISSFLYLWSCCEELPPWHTILSGLDMMFIVLWSDECWLEMNLLK